MARNWPEQERKHSRPRQTVVGGMGSSTTYGLEKNQTRLHLVFLLQAGAGIWKEDKSWSHLYERLHVLGKKGGRTRLEDRKHGHGAAQVTGKQPKRGKANSTAYGSHYRRGMPFGATIGRRRPRWKLFRITAEDREKQQGPPVETRREKALSSPLGTLGGRTSQATEMCREEGEA